MHIVVASRCAPLPWANGGGVARDLLNGRSGPGGAPAFDWRISVADIDRDGPFSRMPDVDRIFAAIDGRVALRFEASVPPVVADAGPAGEPLRFAGEDAPHAMPAPGGACRALNLMLARGRCVGAMRRIALDDGAPMPAPPDALGADGPGPGLVRACWVERGALRAGGHHAGRDALWVIEAGDPVVRAAGDTRLIEITVAACGATNGGCR